MAKYGIPYMGSKSSIANEVIRIFPKADNFYDLFGGGFSITHAMLLRRSRHFKEFHFNELSPGICELIKDAIDGNYNYDVFKPQFVSREEFFEKKDKNPYIKTIWSFGNNGKGYLFSKEIEPYKRSMHNSIVFNEFDDLAKKTFGMESFKEGFSVTEKRNFLRNKIEYFRVTKIPDFLWPFIKEYNGEHLKQLEQLQQLEGLERLQQLEGLERLQQLEGLERLQQLEGVERLKFYNMSYDLVPIEQNSVIYCDPPYKDTAKYDHDFDHKKFLDWAHNQPNPVYISEYNIEDSRFRCIMRIDKRSLLSSNKRQTKIKEERIYVNKAGYKAILDKKRST